MADLYKGIAGSPITYLTADISANQTTISIADDSALPDAPNICTIGYGEHLETIKYETKSNGVLQNVTRGIEGTPRAWPAGTEVARFFTAYDHNAIIENFNSHLAESVSQTGGVHGLEIESGTFIPYIVGTTVEGTPQYSQRSGQYYRIGNLIFIYLRLYLSAKGGMEGPLNIRGLPFVPNIEYCPLSVSYIDYFTPGSLWETTYVPLPLITGQGYVVIHRKDGRSGYLTANDIQDNFRIILSGVYRI